MGIFLAGFAEIDLTPPPGLELTGYAVADRLATGTHDPLKAVAVVLDDRRQKSLLCSVDLCVMHEAVSRVVRRRVSKRTAIPVERIVIAATHTHSGPKLMNSDLLVNQRWVRDLEDRLTTVMMLADYHRVPARIGASTVRMPGVGGNRRVADGPVDDAVTVLRVDGVREGRPLGAVVGVACHPTVLGPTNREYSADYIGEMRQAMAERHGAALPVAVFNGACGDVNPGGYDAEASLRGETTPNRTFERAADIGRTLGDAAYRAIREAEPKGAQDGDDTPRVVAAEERFEVTLRPMPLPAGARQAADEAERALADAAPDSPEHKAAKAELVYARVTLENARTYADSPDAKMEFDLQAFSVGNWALVALPTEVMAAPGLALKAKSRFPHTIIAAYANRSLGYLPATGTAEARGGYEDRVALFGDWAVDTVLGMTDLMLERLHGRQTAPPLANPAPPVRVKPELKLENTGNPGTLVPSIDFHLHWWSHWHGFDEVLARMDAANVRLGVVLVGDVFPGITLEPVLKLMKPVRDRFFYFTAVDFQPSRHGPGVDDPAWAGYVRDKLRRDVDLGAKGIKLYKDLGLSYVDRRGRLLRPTDPRVAPLWEAAAELGLPVLYHVADPPAFFDPVTPANERYDQLRGRMSWWWGRPGYPSYDALIDEIYELTAAHRGVNFVFPHCASLSNDLRRCGQFIASGDNVYVDLSARLPQLARQPHRAHDFCVEHADRVIFGTDDSLPGRNGVYPLWVRLLETRDEYFGGDYYGVASPWRFYGMGLPPETLKKIYWDNAARLLGLES